MTITPTSNSLRGTWAVICPWHQPRCFHSYLLTYFLAFTNFAPSPFTALLSYSTITYLRPGSGALLTPRKIAFDGGPGRRGNRYQALSGEGASEDEYETYPYGENESSALFHGGG